MEPRYYLAVTARKRCERGEFEICGLRLEPFSFRHALQLEAAQSPLWDATREPTPADYFFAAAICSHPGFFVGEVPEITPADLASFDLDATEEVWLSYLAACYHSRPELWPSPDGPATLKAPLSEIVVTYISRNCAAYSREELFTLPIAEVLWIFEAIKEQIGEKSGICTAEEKAKMEQGKTAAAKAETAKREAQYALIKKHVKGGKARQSLFVQVLAGTLPRDWLKKHKARQRNGR